VLVTQARWFAALALVAVAGFALAACGGGGSGTITRTGQTVTRPSGTTATVTTEVTTPAPQPPPPPPPPAPVSESSSSTPWGWIIVGVAIAAALLIGLVVWRRHRAGAKDWGRETAQFNRRCLVAMDDVMDRGSVVTGQVEALAAEARSLEARAPDDASRAAAASVRSRLDELAGALETDRRLRLGSPPPTQEQLSYSTALIRQQVDQLQGTLRPHQAGEAPAWPAR
jgi:hypothetical protein